MCKTVPARVHPSPPPANPRAAQGRSLARVGRDREPEGLGDLLRQGDLRSDRDALRHRRQESVHLTHSQVEVRRELSADVEAVWGQIGRFDDLRWTGDDEWEFDGSTRTLAAHGLKEELVSRSECSYTYRMVEGPFAVHAL